MSEEDESLVLHIRLGDEVRSTTKKRFLHDTWTGFFDSVCLICSAGFDPPQQPPIRTLSLSVAQDDPGNTSTTFLRIHNRHLHCIVKHDIQYIPISHAWHQPVSLAHLSKLSNKQAKHLVYQVPVQSLIAAIDKFGPDTEIWHDYISVPQWQTDTQQRLLLQLPTIFAHPQTCLMHVDDFSTESLGKIFRTFETTTTYALSSEERLQEIAKFYNARWHQRMWVALELAHSQKACILTKEYNVFKDEKVLSDSFLDFVDYFRNEIRLIAQQLGHQRFLELFYELQLKELNYLRKETNPCFGEVFSLIASKECSEPRDRHLAIASFLGMRSHDELCEQFRGKTTSEVCEWVWKTALQQGDCGPLLLVQSPTSKLTPHNPRWIAGAREMKSEMWRLGRLVQPPGTTICTSTDGPLRLKLESVGTITDVRFCESTTTAKLEQEQEFCHIVRAVLTCLSCRTSAGFVSAMGRIYPVVLSCYFDEALPITFEEYVNSNPDFVLTLDNLLSEFRRYLNEHDEFMQQTIAQEIIDLLSLSSPSASKVGFSRITWNMMEGCFCYMPAVASIHCHTCDQDFPFRLELLGEPADVAEVYRIPGLQYASTLQNGTGIVVSRGEIIGRMRSGTPACSCKLLVDVEL